MPESNAKPLYREVQQFRQLWLWALLIIIALIPIWGVVQQLFMGKPFGNNPAPDAVLIVLLVVISFGLPYAFYKLNLTTEVHGDGIYYRFFPFHLSFHRIRLEDLAGYEARTYSALKDYGGWGIRYGRGGRAYNVYGNRGVQLEFANGDKLLLGSQKPEELASAINRALGKT